MRFAGCARLGASPLRPPTDPSTSAVPDGLLHSWVPALQALAWGNAPNKEEAGKPSTTNWLPGPALASSMQSREAAEASVRGPCAGLLVCGPPRCLLSSCQSPHWPFHCSLVLLLWRARGRWSGQSRPCWCSLEAQGAGRRQQRLPRSRRVLSYHSRPLSHWRVCECAVSEPGPVASAGTRFGESVLCGHVHGLSPHADGFPCLGVGGGGGQATHGWFPRPLWIRTAAPGLPSGPCPGLSPTVRWGAPGRAGRLAESLWAPAVSLGAPSASHALASFSCGSSPGAALSFPYLATPHVLSPSPLGQTGHVEPPVMPDGPQIRWKVLLPVPAVGAARTQRFAVLTSRRSSSVSPSGSSPPRTPPQTLPEPLLTADAENLLPLRLLEPLPTSPPSLCPGSMKILLCPPTFMTGSPGRNSESFWNLLYLWQSFQPLLSLEPISSFCPHFFLCFWWPSLTPERAQWPRAGVQTHVYLCKPIPSCCLGALSQGAVKIREDSQARHALTGREVRCPPHLWIPGLGRREPAAGKKAGDKAKEAILTQTTFSSWHWPQRKQGSQRQPAWGVRRDPETSSQHSFRGWRELSAPGPFFFGLQSCLSQLLLLVLGTWSRNLDQMSQHLSPASSVRVLSHLGLPVAFTC